MQRQLGLALLKEAYELQEAGRGPGGHREVPRSQATQTDLGINVETEIEDVRRQVATQWVQQGEALAKGGDFLAAEAKFKAALALDPPPDTPVYVYVPAGPFFMGEDASSAFTGTLPAYWIQRTEVTNAQYLRCVEAGSRGGMAASRRPTATSATGIPSSRSSRSRASPGTRPGTTPHGPAAGCPRRPSGRRPAGGTDGRTYPWGNQDPTGIL